MAFFNPLGAFSAGVGGFMKGKDEAVDRQTKEYDLMGMQALGRAFQLPQGPIPGIPGIGPQGPQAPFPGQPSMPAQPAVQPPGPQVAAAGPPQSFSGGGGGPVGGGMGLNPDTAAGAPYGGAVQPQQIADALARMRQGQGQPTGGFQPQAAVAQAQQQEQAPQQPPMPPQAAPMQPPQQQQPQQRPPQTNEQGMPQFDLQTLIQRIQRANPNLPPQAMVSALTRAVPLLNLEGKQQLAMMRQEMMAGNLDIRREMLGLARDRAGRTSEKEEEKKSQVEKIGDAIIAGDQPPTLTGLYRDRAAIQSYLADKKYSLSKAQQEWNAAQKQIGSLNSQRMIQFAGTAKSVINTIDEVKTLADEMELSGIPLLNKAELAVYAQTQGNTPNGQLATRYLTAVNTLKEEFATVANGGYAPTESVWHLANKQINENYGVKQMNASLNEIRRLMGFRLQAIPNLDTLGGGSANRYTGQQGQPIVPPPPGGGGQQSGAAQLPPEAVKALKPGQVTTFGNGQKWTIENGQPKQVQ